MPNKIINKNLFLLHTYKLIFVNKVIKKVLSKYFFFI